MNNTIRLLVVGGLCAAAVLILGLGMAGNHGALLAPAHLLLFLLAVAVYLLPAILALYRSCTATLWIAAVDVFLGWTIFGWFVALGWAASGKARTLPPTMVPPAVHPAPNH